MQVRYQLRHSPKFVFRDLWSSLKQPDQLNPKSPRCESARWRRRHVPPPPETGTADRAKKNPPESFDSGGSSGGAEGTRTPDPLHAMQVRYQLRHSPVFSLLRTSGEPDPVLCPDLSEATQIS